MHPTVYTEATRKRLLEAAKMGATVQDCAAYAGVARRTLYNWLDPDASEEHQAFAREFREARAQGRLLHLGVINSAARDGDWKASAWLLKATGVFRDASQPTVSVQTGGGPVTLTISSELSAELAAEEDE